MPGLARITITIPDDLVSAADARAAALGRSRSWVISDALRRTFAPAEPPAPAPAPTAPAGAPPGAPLGNSAGTGTPAGLDPADPRSHQLDADLALTPEARVLAAEATARVGDALRGPRGQQLVGFERYEDYLDWRFRRSIGA